jgi:nitroreductase
MELQECITKRRSIRAFTEETVPKELIDAVLEAGIWAPTGMHREPWRFVVIENKKLIKYVSDETKKLVQKYMPPLATQFSTDLDVVCYNAPVLIMICTEKDAQWKDVNLLDCVLASQNMFLKAHELGLGTCYMGFVNLINSKSEILRKLGVPENYDMMVPFVLGYPKNPLGTGKRKQPVILNWTK